MLLRRVFLTNPRQKKKKSSFLLGSATKKNIFTFLSYPLVRFICADPNRFKFFFSLWVKERKVRSRSSFQLMLGFDYYYLLLLLLLFLTAIELSLDGSSPYTSTDKTNKNKYTWKKQYKNTVNTSTHITKTPTQLSKHLHNCQNTYTIVKTPTQLSKHLRNCQNT